MPIPASLLNDLLLVPRDRPVSLLMRHSERHPILDSTHPFDAGLTEEGIQLAEELGRILNPSFSPGRVMSAPVERCYDTAKAIVRGASWPVQPAAHDTLSHPFMAPAWNLYVEGKVNGTPPAEVLITLKLLLQHASASPMLEIMVTHDTVLGAVVGCLLHEPVLDEFWPDFLEGVFLWKKGNQLAALWRGQEQDISMTRW